jgi:hypothetical protein
MIAHPIFTAADLPEEIRFPLTGLDKLEVQFTFIKLRRSFCYADPQRLDKLNDVSGNHRIDTIAP